ncbi:MAG: HAD family phosphatase [Clostridia bacterium]|nr:HAD family phosphatase [Clostridia bacterium]
MKAALFDLDGTLFDSLGVWADIDAKFFAQRGLALPRDYAATISGLSFRQTAEYTKEHFPIAESVDEIITIWHDMCKTEYVERVLLKPFAREYLLKLRQKGIKLAVVTTLTRELYEPCLKRNGIFELFDVFATTDETSAHKRTGKVYLLAAERLGVNPCDCAVFEDIYEGLEGAKAAGMSACLVYDRHNQSRIERAKEIADHYIKSYEGLELWI